MLIQGETHLTAPTLVVRLLQPRANFHNNGPNPQSNTFIAHKQSSSYNNDQCWESDVTDIRHCPSDFRHQYAADDCSAVYVARFRSVGTDSVWSRRLRRSAVHGCDWRRDAHTASGRRPPGAEVYLQFDNQGRRLDRVPGARCRNGVLLAFVGGLQRRLRQRPGILAGQRIRPSPDSRSRNDAAGRNGKPIR